MKRIGTLAAALIVGLVFAISLVCAVQNTDAASDTLAQRILDVHLPAEPDSIDPALIAESHSALVAEQLFLGLVDLDDGTGDIHPELASSWEISDDVTVYTFTLRSDVYWSDGHPLTAEDVRYGILRSLDPATGSNRAYVLHVIDGAWDYASGALTDTAQVGVTAIDTTTLRIDLEEPAAHVLSILGMWVARPVPSWTIKAHGAPTWTEASNIVTNGAYRLAEWVHDDHITLVANPTYYGGSPQINEVRMQIVDASTALTMYAAGELDTMIVPYEHLDATRADPLLSQEQVAAPRGCTYHYGFSLDQPPFDDLLVRRALAAATDRQAVIDNVTRGEELPALTYTPPGHLGHVDGYAEDVGIPYNPAQAQQWLADAGYPGGAGFPSITLWFNESAGHQAIAEYVRDGWYTTLGISVALDSKPWNEYLEGPFSDYDVWRLGWCSDFSDAMNFLGDGVNPSRFAGWDSTAYENLLEEAREETDPTARKALYKQAEATLVMTDAVMLPLYYYSTVHLTKPYLERTYSSIAPDISGWRLIFSSAVIGPAGGELWSWDERNGIHAPSGAFTDTVILTLSPATAGPPGGEGRLTGHVFNLSGVYSSTNPAISGLPAQIAPGGSVEITILYDPWSLGPGGEHMLGLYRWDDGTGGWTQDGISSTVQADMDRVLAEITHLSVFALIDDTRYNHLPFVRKP